MIKNERQYRITKAQIERFRESLELLEIEHEELRGNEPTLLEIRHAAIQGLLNDLEEDIQAYENLKKGVFDYGQVVTITDLPKFLIMARIARGLTQRELADQMGLKEQQIQRYEASEYSSASFTRLKTVAEVLGVGLGAASEVSEVVSIEHLTNSITQTGLSPDFVWKRLIPRFAFAFEQSPENDEEDKLAVKMVAEYVGRIFNWPLTDLMRGQPLNLDTMNGGVRFKVTAGANQERVSAYTVYAHYLSSVVAKASSVSSDSVIPSHPLELREAILAEYDEIDLQSVVKFVWDLGIGVLPLDDPSAFQGACFRENSRNVIVLKQRTASEARWLADLLHELWHASQEPDAPERAFWESEETSEERRTSREEIVANQFAAAVLLEGRAQELADMCIDIADGEIRFLKSAVQTVASQEDVPTDSLANYLAFRLDQEQGENWWGTAHNLQRLGDPWATVRDVFFERVDFNEFGSMDREVLTQALTPWRHDENE